MLAKYVSNPVRLPSASALGESKRWQLVIHGIDQSGPSYEGRVFFNNPQADTATPPNVETGYVGSFHVYGYGLSAGETPQLPMDRAIDATDSIKRELGLGRHEVTVTVVPISAGIGPRQRAVEGDLTIKGVELFPK